MKTISQYLPALSVLLVFLGYCNLYFYFSRFDIPIYFYVSTGEIVLSFLPIILQVAVLFFVFFGFRFLMQEPTKPKPRKQSRSASFYFFFLINKSARSRLTLRRQIGVFWKAVTHESNIFPSAVVLFTLFLLTRERMYEWKSLAQLVTIFWLAILVPFFGRKAIEKAAHLGHGGAGPQIIFFTLIIAFVCFNYVDRTLTADLVLHGRPTSSARFDIEGRSFASDSITVYVGMTQGYVFFRNVRTSQNIIFNKSHISSLVLEEIPKR